MLYKRCHDDAENHCHAKKKWHDKPENLDPERGPIVLPCLYRYAYHPDKNVKVWIFFLLCIFYAVFYLYTLNYVMVFKYIIGCPHSVQSGNFREMQN